jgi:hypothetical protein
MWIGVCTAIFGLINILLYLAKNFISIYRALRDIGKSTHENSDDEELREEIRYTLERLEYLDQELKTKSNWGYESHKIGFIR